MNTHTSIKALQIQTVQTKTVIKMTQAQLQSLIKQPKRLSDQTTPVHSTVWKDNTVLRSQEKVCGLFNQEIDVNKDTGPFDMETNLTKTQNKSKFSKRISEANLHINLNQNNNSTSHTDDESFNLNLEDFNLDQFLTPQTKNECFSFFKSMPSPTAQASTDILLDDESKELECIPTCDLYDATKFDNPFSNQLPADLELVPNEPNECLNLDHAYSNKRKLSIEIEDNSFFSQDSFNLLTSSPAPSTSNEPTKKKQRTKGIYRAKDVKNEEDYVNYLERRKKNNISSKMSRSNKKSLHNQMDTKSDELEMENKKLSEKIAKLENIHKAFKEFILTNIK